ncbi:hypothetical protein ACFQ2B_33995 [Streptomyces stramineus]
MRVVVLGEFRVDRLVPRLREGGADVVVLAFVELTSFLGPGVEYGALPTALSERALLELLGDYGADLVVPNPGCPGQEQFLPVYARAAEGLRAAGKRVPVHAEAFATLASDKVAFHRIARRRGWPVPRAVVCGGRGGAGGGPRARVSRARQRGPQRVSRRAALRAGRRPPRPGVEEVTCPVLVQQAVEGEEYAVELLSDASSTIAWPVASLYRLDGDCSPGRRVRVAPAALPARARAELIATVVDMVENFGPWGPWQLDFAVTDDGRLQVIELNGRLGGVSNMSWISTGLDPHAAHGEAALGLPSALRGSAGSRSSCRCATARCCRPHRPGRRWCPFPAIRPIVGP